MVVLHRAPQNSLSPVLGSDSLSFSGAEPMAPRSPAAEGQTPCSSTTSTFPVPSASISDTSAISGAVPTVPHGPVADCQLNVCSIVHKREQLEHLLNNSNINFLGLTETWLSSSSPEAVITMWDYRVFRKDRDRGKGGGSYCMSKTLLTVAR